MTTEFLTQVDVIHVTLRASQIVKPKIVKNEICRPMVKIIIELMCNINTISQTKVERIIGNRQSPLEFLTIKGLRKHDSSDL